MSAYPAGTPPFPPNGHYPPYWMPPPPPKPKSRVLKVFFIVTASLLAVVMLTVLSVVGTYSEGSDQFEDARAQAHVAHTVNMRMNAILDAPPYGVTDEQWDAFWSEPAMNSPEMQDLLEAMAAAWEYRLREDESELEWDAGSISDSSRREDAQASVDLLSQAIEGGLHHAGKRRIYGDLAEVITDACYGRATFEILYDGAGRPTLEGGWMATSAYTTWSSNPHGQRIGDLVKLAYPAAFDAGLKHHCESPYPPLASQSQHPGDAEIAKSVSDEVDRVLGIVTENPNDTEFMSEENWEKLWEQPALNTPEAQAYLDRLTDRALEQYRKRIAGSQAKVDQIQDEALRAHTQVYLGRLTPALERDGGKHLGIDILYSDLSEFWHDTCSNDTTVDIMGYSKVEFDLTSKEPRPTFNSATIESADAGDYEPGDKEWSEKSLEMAMEVYPGAYKAGVRLYCE